MAFRLLGRETKAADFQAEGWAFRVEVDILILLEE